MRGLGKPGQTVVAQRARLRARLDRMTQRPAVADIAQRDFGKFWLRRGQSVLRCKFAHALVHLGNDRVHEGGRSIPRAFSTGSASGPASNFSIAWAASASRACAPTAAA